MKVKQVVGAFALLLWTVSVATAQQLSPKWEELTAEDFVKALQLSSNVCVLPFGILEKHGPSGPLGTDLINVRASTLQAVKQQYAIVFPEYYFGQIAEARHEPGTVAYHADLQLALLQATVEEMARNGCHKVLIVNGHGGNNGLLQYFNNIQLDSAKDYTVYIYNGLGGGPGEKTPAAAMPSKPGVDGHAGESEIAGIMAVKPEIAHPERAGEESGANHNGIRLPQGLTTPIWWYASYPDHYAGDAAGATAARGVALQDMRAESIEKVIAFVKADTAAPELQKQFFEKTVKPVETKQ